jgi:FMN phosphatase YigB (HAD superfamily)
LRIGIDFDHVLFDTEKFKRKLFDEIEQFNDTYDQAKDKDGNYRPEKHAEILDIPVEKVHKAIKHSEECLYPDVKRLEEIPEEHEIIIVSRGDPDFQDEKIQSSGVLDYVESYVVVVDAPKDEAAEIDFLVDDAKVEHERADLPENRKFLFQRPEDSIDDLVRRLNENE